MDPWKTLDYVQSGLEGSRKQLRGDYTLDTGQLASAMDYLSQKMRPKSHRHMWPDPNAMALPTMDKLLVDPRFKEWCAALHKAGPELSPTEVFCSSF
jgi:hypothetical protein